MNDSKVAMSSRPYVSTIIPAFNAEKYVAEAIDSALAQRDVDNEVLVVDDGSTDRTWEILEGYGDRIRPIRQRNCGIVAARNRAANMARGNWLAFLDADDQWASVKLCQQLGAVRDDPGLVYTDRVNTGAIGHVKELQSSSTALYEGDVLDTLIMENFITTSSVMIRKDWFDRLGGFHPDLDVCEDWDLWLRFAGAGGRVRLCREPLTFYRWHASSMTQNLVRMRDGRLKVVHRALATEKGRRLGRTVARRALANAWSCSAWYAAPTQPWTAAKWYLSSARQWPFALSPFKGLVKCLFRTS